MKTLNEHLNEAGRDLERKFFLGNYTYPATPLTLDNLQSSFRLYAGEIVKKILEDVVPEEKSHINDHTWTNTKLRDFDTYILTEGFNQALSEVAARIKEVLGEK